MTLEIPKGLLDTIKIRRDSRPGLTKPDFALILPVYLAMGKIKICVRIIITMHIIYLFLRYEHVNKNNVQKWVRDGL